MGVKVLLLSQQQSDTNSTVDSIQSLNGLVMLRAVGHWLSASAGKKELWEHRGHQLLSMLPWESIAVDELQAMVKVFPVLSQHAIVHKMLQRKESTGAEPAAKDKSFYADT